MNQPDNQSIINNGVIANVSDSADAGLLDDLSAQNADAIKGGPVVISAGAGNDMVFCATVDNNHRR
jgi:hypothetical protein